MTYEGLYDIFKYFKEMDIELTKDLKDFVITLDVIWPSEYFIFKHNLDVIKEYFSIDD